MKGEFIESREFAEWVSEFLPDHAYSQLQQELMDNPEKEPRLRWTEEDSHSGSQTRQGKEERRSGDLFAYPRGKMVLSGGHLRQGRTRGFVRRSKRGAQKKELSKLAAELKREAKAALGRRSRSQS